MNERGERRNALKMNGRQLKARFGWIETLRVGIIENESAYRA